MAPVTRELGREAIFTEMDDLVIIVDDERRIVDVNAAATALFDGDQNTLLGRSLPQASPTLAETVPGPGERTQTETALERDGRVRYCDVRCYRCPRVQYCYNRRISLRDIADRRQREQRLEGQPLAPSRYPNEMNVIKRTRTCSGIRPMPTNASDSTVLLARRRHRRSAQQSADHRGSRDRTAQPDSASDAAGLGRERCAGPSS